MEANNTSMAEHTMRVRDDDDTMTDPIGGNLRSSVTLNQSGSNFQAFQLATTYALQAHQYAWEVVSGKLVPPTIKPDVPPTPEQKKQQEQYDQGNRIGKGLII